MESDTLLWFYVVGIVLAWVPCTIPLVDPYDDADDPVAIAMWVGIGLCIATMWPLLIIGAPVYLIVRLLTTPEK